MNTMIKPGVVIRRNKRWLVLSLAPVAVFFLVLSGFPVLNLLGLSFFDVEWREGAAEFNYIGLENYHRLFLEETIYWAGVRNTLVFAVTVVTCQMVLGFSMALAVKRAGSVGRTILTGIFLLPIVIPPIVIGTMWRLVMGREFGLANTLLRWFGLNEVDWLGNPDIALASVMFVDIWHWTPFVFLLMLAGLESLDEEVLDAARLDVTGFWQEVRHIVLPLMLPTILITVIFRVILSFKVFDEVYLLTSGGPGTATEVVNFSIYRTFFRQDQVGYGSAMSVVTLFAIALTIILARGVLARRRNAEEAE
ncbi:MAG: sugar ABC transporter permease [Oricola sp.]|jgi:multiple sugar transport system permease protein|uniref:carbohydrate ABC transporter permease n=1 Tax=Roseibium aggregatum TaxID=187304 RepID=UPI000C945807|nr:sugar ABC transporter permease [Roseibium aggregatum]MAS03349.1 transcriptional regulator [Ahrensia sp.]MAZ16326.1 transcriptional regulator [Ahrensia sp.]MCK5745611.1 sugar ABC transporter permease [Oricola sp.]UES53975.1 ABC transporter permease subunit [Roseibium aggregatum]|tara:strand:- start:1590 stop:2510 length:921 start_codon:yes stop_codon:yes gene_type:complete